MYDKNQMPPPDNNLVWAILATVLCCIPFGIVAIIKASKVEELWYQGRHEEAQKAADDAKKWSIYSALSVGIIIVVYIIIMLFVVLINGINGF